MKILLPPFTRACLMIVVTLSALVAFLRYSEYSRQYADVTKPVVQPDTDEHRSPPHLPQLRDIQVPYLVLVPSLSIIYPWVILTSGFVEQTVTGFVVTLATLAYAGRYCERVWGGKQLAIFVAILCALPNFLCLLWMVFVYAVTGSSDVLLSNINGGVALQTGFLVAFKQLVPEHSIVLFRGMFKAQVKHIVLPIVLAYSLVGVIIRRTPLAVLPWMGFLTSWIYLRFYRVTYIESILPLSSSLTQADSEQSKIRGDASDTFAFSKFFHPQSVRAVVIVISDVVFAVLVALKICTPFSTDEVEASNLQASLRTSRSAGSVRDTEADRRRTLAMKVLEERLEVQRSGD
jgi:membrane associated rhomboid family serine protease